MLPEDSIYVVLLTLLINLNSGKIRDFFRLIKNNLFFPFKNQQRYCLTWQFQIC
jgi:hypothetical protein